VRTRLTLWYIAVLSGVLALYVGITLVFLHVSLSRELDRTLRDEYERSEDLLTEGPDRSIRTSGHDEEGEDSLVEVWSTTGQLLYRNEGLPGGEVRTLPPPASDGWSLESLVVGPGTPVRALSHARSLGSRRVIVRVAVSEARFRHEWRELLAGLLLGLPVAVAIAGVGGHWLARGALAPLDRMASHAERLTAENLGERLPVENPEDELGHLARVFNLSLARLEGSFAQLRRFTADASHELRTPLTAIRAVGEVALQQHQEPERYREAIGSMLEEVDRLTHLVGSLLVLSRADVGTALHRQERSLLDLARESAALVEILAEEKGQRIEVRGDAGVRANVDGLILRQAIVNLIDNAIKYAAPRTTVRIDVGGTAAGGATIAVTDEGPGIPEAHRAHVFERFYRVDKARSREEGGAGLGLSIALWAVEAHGGRIDLETAEGKGSSFRIVLPASAAEARA
jgi:heavy metal sensor kinase